LWRLRRASAIETGLFDIQAEFLLAPGQDPSRGPGQPMTLQTVAQANGHKLSLARTDETIRWPATKNHCPRRPRAAARTMVEVPRHRPMFPAPLQSWPNLA
jgi:hypothetical protein